jgi:hypothetical protein
MKKLLISVGIFLIGVSVIFFGISILGVVEIDNFAILGHSGIRSIAAIAVLGCLIAAIGVHE